jgi:integrase
MSDRREYGSGSVYQMHATDCPKPTNAKGESTCRCKWRGSTEAGFTSTGGRRRLTVTGKTEAEAKRKLRDKVADVRSGEVTLSPTTTVKAWSDTWLPIKRATMAPNGYAALSSPIRQWIIPTIGHKRLTQVSPADVRAVEAAQRAKGRKGTTAAATQRALFNMLRAAIAEGHAVPPRVLMVPMPETSNSDRKPLTIPEALAVLAKASELPHGTRWAVALLHGFRQGECLGLTWDALDLDAGTVSLEWQLQRLKYADKHDRSKGFYYPPEREFRHLYKAWHLSRPKSKAGIRIHPLMPAVTRALRAWREVAPENPYGLVWPTPEGKPRLHTDDLREWHDLQAAAGVRHPSGRPYHVHECRNVTATELNRVGADAATMTALMGHTSITTTQGYIAVDMDARRAALEKVAALLQLG